jgi:serine O-acetyltransferase
MRPAAEQAPPDSPRAALFATMADMLNALRLLREDLREKARWCYQSDAPAAIAKTLATDGTAAMILYRLMQGARDARLVPLELACNKLNSMLNACVIGRGAEFGPGFVIVHSNGIVINGKVKGGSNIHLEHQVTIGDSGAGACPVLGNDVYIGAGAKVIGPVAIGDGARVGANAVVVHDVDPDTTVVGVPAKPVRRRSDGTVDDHSPGRKSAGLSR